MTAMAGYDAHMHPWFNNKLNIRQKAVLPYFPEAADAGFRQVPVPENSG
jgi:hypothetical protein